jgi:hypothetical protein
VTGGTHRLAATRREAIAEQARAAAEMVPRLYLPLARRRNPGRIPLDASADLVVEGFPRAGNSFLMSWFACANPELRIASHLHSIANVTAALRLGVPAVVVIRPPATAIASLALFSPAKPLDQHIARYRRFHRGVLAVADDVVISPFPTTTGDPSVVVEAVATRSGRQLVLTPPGGRDEVTSAVEALSVKVNGALDERKVGRPSEARRQATTAVVDLLHDRFAAELADLEQLYEQLASGPSAVIADLSSERPVP